MSSGLRTNEELARSVDELRKNIADVIEGNKKFHDDFFLIQWLKRHSFKVKQTESMIRESIEWCKTNDMESLKGVESWVAFPGLCEEFPVYIDSQHQGLPVFTFNGNGVDFVAVVKKYGKDTILRYLYYFVLKAEQLTVNQIHEIRRECDNLELADMVQNKFVSRDGRKLSVGVLIIASFKDVSLWAAKSPVILSLMMEGAKVFSNYFPVFVNQVFFINANKIIETVFKLMKPFISSPYYPVDCYDLNKSKWSAAILKHVDPSHLTPEFGGTRRMSIKS